MLPVAGLRCGCRHRNASMIPFIPVRLCCRSKELKAFMRLLRSWLRGLSRRLVWGLIPCCLFRWFLSRGKVVIENPHKSFIAGTALEYGFEKNLDRVHAFQNLHKLLFCQERASSALGAVHVIILSLKF